MSNLATRLLDFIWKKNPDMFLDMVIAKHMNEDLKKNKDTSHIFKDSDFDSFKINCALEKDAISIRNECINQIHKYGDLSIADVKNITGATKTINTKDNWIGWKHDQLDKLKVFRVTAYSQTQYCIVFPKSSLLNASKE